MSDSSPSGRSAIRSLSAELLPLDRFLSEVLREPRLDAQSAAAWVARVQDAAEGSARARGASVGRGALATGMFTRHMSPGASASARRRRTVRWMALAILVIAMVGAIGVSSYIRPTATAVRDNAYVTGPGERATIQLGDGSRVILAPSTTMRVHGFGNDARAVELEGQAYFDVVAQHPAPFIVRTHGTTTRVLGTRFTVSHYPGNAPTRVAVASGKVSVATSRSGAHAVTLTARMVAVIDDSTVTTSVGNDLTSYTAWTNGTLIFDGTTVDELLSTVGRWYGYEFQLKDSALARQHVSMQIDGNARSAMLRELQEMLGVHMVFRGRVITLSPKQSMPAARAKRRIPIDSATSTMEVGR